LVSLWGYLLHGYFIDTCGSFFIPVNSCLFGAGPCQTNEKAVFLTWPHPWTTGANDINPFRNLLSKLVFMCSGYGRESHASPHGCGGSSKIPRELCSQWKLLLFKGVVLRCFLLKCLRPLKKPKKNPKKPSECRVTSKNLQG
jgi:hypothetical protein